MPVKHLLIHGYVQGVGFRWSLAHEARSLGLKGWVRNRREGMVEAVIAGEDAAVERLVEWAHRGPLVAHVTRVEVSEGQGSFTGFEQRPSA